METDSGWPRRENPGTLTGSSLSQKQQLLRSEEAADTWVILAGGLGRGPWGILPGRQPVQRPSPATLLQHSAARPGPELDTLLAPRSRGCMSASLFELVFCCIQSEVSANAHVDLSNGKNSFRQLLEDIKEGNTHLVRYEGFQSLCDPK